MNFKRRFFIRLVFYLFQRLKERSMNLLSTIYKNYFRNLIKRLQIAQSTLYQVYHQYFYVAMNFIL